MFEEEIARGAEWLDEVKPGWELKIDLGNFSITSACNCVLGQLFGDYDDGVEYHTRLAPRYKAQWPGSCGFVVSDYRSERYQAWKQLNDEWVDFIKARLDAGVQLPD